jgi:hypothetical protein
MQELQQVIISRDSTVAQRDAARSELTRMLMSPAGQAKPLPEEANRKPRAAIDPYPSIVKPVNVVPAPASPPVAGVARVDVVEPPKIVVQPRTGTLAVPIPTAPAFAIDPRTGSVVHPAGPGYVDPKTGQFVPR